MENPFDGQQDFSVIGSTLSAGIGGFFTWLFTRKKNKVEIETSEIDNVEKAVAIWRNIASDLEGKFTALQKEVYDMRVELMKTNLANKELIASNESLKNEVHTLRKQMSV